MARKKQTQYRFGVGLEYRVKSILEKSNWLVTRSASSKGLVDLTATNSDCTLLIQCKKTRGIVSINSLLKEENVVKLLNFPVHNRARKLLIFQQNGTSNNLKVLEVINQRWELSRI